MGGRCEAMSAEIKSVWREGFSSREKNWKIQNSSPPFSADDYRRIDTINSERNLGVMEAVFQRIEESCVSYDG